LGGEAGVCEVAIDVAPFFDQGRKDAKPLCALSVYRQVLEPILAAKIVIFADIGKFIRVFFVGDDVLV